VGQGDHIGSYDTLTLAETARSGAYGDNCGRELAVTGAKRWHTTTYAYNQNDCGIARTYLDSFVNGANVRTNWNTAGKQLPATGPGAPNRLFMGEARNANATDPFLTSFDTTGDNPVRGDARRFADAAGNGALDLKDLAISADGARTIAVDVAKAPTALALTAPEEASMSTGVEITGRLTAQGRPLPAGVTLSVERADRLGTGSLSSVPVAADGTFTVRDLPRARRDVTYTVSYGGDALHSGSTASATVYVRR
jgi:hypothetical protein